MAEKMNENDKLIISLLEQMQGVFDAQDAYFSDARKTGIKGAKNQLFIESTQKEKAMKERIKKGLLYYKAKERLAPFNAK